MCGFVGILTDKNSEIDEAQLVKMQSRIAHRGQDGSGLKTLSTHTSKNRNLGLAFQRLSIIDLSQNAAQPMTNADESLWMVFNGEIYNFKQLKSELKNKREFKSKSDTEVILALYEEYGTAAFAKLNGMFAIALWDAKKEKLILARDRIGIKPLYYSTTKNGIVFGSEIKALLPYDGVNRGFDPIGLSEHFTFQYCLKDRTVFEGIKLVQPGYFLEIDHNHPTKIKPTRYWDFTYHIDNSLSEKQWAEKLRIAIENSVKRQLVSDVPIGAYLSGGMDTGSIVAIASRFTPHMHSYTCGFEHDASTNTFLDEREHAAELAKLLNTNHHEIMISNNTMANTIGKVTWHMEEPRCGISYQNYIAAGLAAQHTKVVLSGTGGDEIFAGYPWRYNPILSLKNKDKFNSEYYKICTRLLPDSDRAKLLKNADHSPFVTFKSVLDECPSDEPLNKALYFDAKGFLHSLLLLEDRLSMAHTLESRVPLLDNEIIELVEQMPPSVKYAKDQPKKILKQALKGILSDEVINRRKIGFTTPDEIWFKNQSYKFIEKTLLSEKFSDMGIFETQAIKDILSAHTSGQKDYRFLIWSLMCVGYSAEHFMDC